MNFVCHDCGDTVNNESEPHRRCLFKGRATTIAYEDALDAGWVRVGSGNGIGLRRLVHESTAATPYRYFTGALPGGTKFGMMFVPYYVKAILACAVDRSENMDEAIELTRAYMSVALRLNPEERAALEAALRLGADVREALQL